MVAPIILAIDDPKHREIVPRIVERACRLVAGFKIGLPYILGTSREHLESLREKCDGSLWICDLKLADIGYVMKLSASILLDYFDGFIAHSFVGSTGALADLKEFLDGKGKKLIAVYAMSHPGSREVYLNSLSHIDRVVERVRPWGLVIGATLPEIIEKTSRQYSWARILSPGIGVQGAKPGEAVCRGASYEIVGRTIIESKEPLKKLDLVIKAQREAIEKCGKSVA